MVNPAQQPEAEPKKPSAHESVESFIQKKQAEKESEVKEAVSEKMAGVGEEVAEVMVGAEKPKEKVSERGEKKGEKGIPGAATGVTGDEDQSISVSLKDYQFPSSEVMVKVVRKAIRDDISWNWKMAKRYKKELNRGGAVKYNAAIARIRQLKEMLASLLTATVGFLKDVYVKYFTPDGKRRSMKDVQ